MLDIRTNFGAVGDGITDDTAAFQAAASLPGTEVYIPFTPGGYKITNSITVVNNITFVGAGSMPRIATAGLNPGLPLFNIQGSDISIKNLWIDDMSRHGKIFQYNTAAGHIERVKIDNIQGRGCGLVFCDNGGTGLTITNHITNCQFRLQHNRGIYFTRSFAFNFVTDVTFDYVGGNAAFNEPIVAVVGAQGFYFTRVYLLGGPIVNNPYSYGFYIQNSQAVHFSECHADTVGGTGFMLLTVEYLQADTITASLNGGHGVYMANVKQAIFTNVILVGRVGLPSAQPGAYGMYFDVGTDKACVTGVVGSGFTGGGLYKSPKAGATMSGIGWL